MYVEKLRKIKLTIFFSANAIV